MNKFVDYANSFQALANLELKGIKRLTELLGNPQDELKFIHVAGTNGKGSVCSFLQTAFTKSGLKTGKYISPNLIDVCERISIDNICISKVDLERLMETVQEKCNIVYNETKEYPTQFEIWTATAFLYFKENKTDIVVLETGLGGEKDATNIVKNTLCSVITKISYDHISYLGDSITDIAKAKAGIIKKPFENGAGLCFTTIQEKEVNDVLKKKAKEESNELIVCEIPSSNGFNGSSEIFDYLGIENILCGLSGIHQLENAALAITVLKRLKISDEDIKFGIENAKNPARFETLSQSPLIIFDGAHNPDGVLSFVKNLNRYYSDVTKNFIMGVMADKDLENITDILKKYDLNKKSTFYTVTVKNNPRAMKNSELAEFLNKSGFNAEPRGSISEALISAKKEKDAVFIIGSLYLYKDLIEEGQL